MLLPPPIAQRPPVIAAAMARSVPPVMKTSIALRRATTAAVAAARPQPQPQPVAAAASRGRSRSESRRRRGRSESRQRRQRARREARDRSISKESAARRENRDRGRRSNSKEKKARRKARDRSNSKEVLKAGQTRDLDVEHPTPSAAPRKQGAVVVRMLKPVMKKLASSAVPVKTKATVMVKVQGHTGKQMTDDDGIVFKKMPKMPGVHKPVQPAFQPPLHVMLQYHPWMLPADWPASLPPPPLRQFCCVRFVAAEAVDATCTRLAAFLGRASVPGAYASLCY